MNTSCFKLIALISFFVFAVANPLHADKNSGLKKSQFLFTGSVLGAVEPCG